MAATIDFSSMDNDELLHGYQRVNRARFPQHFEACAAEITRRGLALPEKFEVCALGEALDFHLFRRLRDGLTTVTGLFGGGNPSARA